MIIFSNSQGKESKVSRVVTQQAPVSRPRCHLKDKKLSLCVSMNCQELLLDIGGKHGQEVVHWEEDHVELWRRMAMEEGDIDSFPIVKYSRCPGDYG